MGPVVAMRGAQISLDESVESLLERHSFTRLSQWDNRSIHGERKRLDDESFARFEMRVEAAMGETGELHQIGHAHAVGATLHAGHREASSTIRLRVCSPWPFT